MTTLGLYFPQYPSLLPFFPSTFPLYYFLFLSQFSALWVKLFYVPTRPFFAFPPIFYMWFVLSEIPFSLLYYFDIFQIRCKILACMLYLGSLRIMLLQSASFPDLSICLLENCLVSTTPAPTHKINQDPNYSTSHISSESRKGALKIYTKCKLWGFLNRDRMESHLSPFDIYSWYVSEQCSEVCKSVNSSVVKLYLDSKIQNVQNNTIMAGAKLFTNRNISQFIIYIVLGILLWKPY